MYCIYCMLAKKKQQIEVQKCKLCFLGNLLMSHASPLWRCAKVQLCFKLNAISMLLTHNDNMSKQFYAKQVIFAMFSIIL